MSCPKVEKREEEEEKRKESEKPSLLVDLEEEEEAAAASKERPTCFGPWAHAPPTPARPTSFDFAFPGKQSEKAG